MDAKAMAEQNAREMESLLSCPICLETFTKPVVILPCQHNLCRSCAEDCFDQRGFRFGVSGGRFKCPTCRYEVILDRHGVMGLPRNLLVENIIDMMEDDKKKVENQYKQKIQEEEEKLNKLKQQEIEEEEKKQSSLCPEHKESLNVYCLSCMKLICATCKVFGDCQNCTVVRMEQAYHQQQQEMQEAIEVITGSSHQVHHAINHINEQKRLTDDVDKEAVNLVKKQFDTIFIALENKKKQLLGKINAVTSETNNVLVTHKLKYEEALSAAEAEIGEALELTREEDNIKFLRQARPLIDNMLKNQCTLEARPPPIAAPNGSKWSINLAPLEEVVKKIDFCSDIRVKQSSTKKKAVAQNSNNGTSMSYPKNATNTVTLNDDKPASQSLTLNSNHTPAQTASEISSIDDGVSVKSFETTKKKQSTFDKLSSMMLGTNIHGKKNRQAAGNSMVTSSVSIGSDKFVDCSEEEVTF